VITKSVETSTESICSGGNLLAIIVSHTHTPEATSFVTDSTQNLQVGFIKYPAGGQIQRHRHLPLERRIVGTNEVLYVRSGSAEVSLYDHEGKLAATRFVVQGDLVILLSGGHGFRLLEDTVFLEIKQGPYTGVDEKERF
jgi:hypothetical protein